MLEERIIEIKKQISFTQKIHDDFIRYDRLTNELKFLEQLKEMIISQYNRNNINYNFIEEMIGGNK